jgi:UPF0716 protein FxsA
MGLRLLTIFILVPLIEILLLLEIGERLGTLNTVLLVILTGILGGTMMRIQGFSVFRKVQEDLTQGIPPARNILEGALVLAGGILLLTPGFFTDGVGFVLLIPRTRRYLLAKLQKAIESRIRQTYGP